MAHASPLCPAPSSSSAAVTNVDDDLDTFMGLLRTLRDRLDRPELLTWKVIYEDSTFQSSSFAERLSSCMSTAKVRKLVRYAVPRLMIGSDEHDDVVVTILWEGASSASLSNQIGVKAQEKHKARLDMLAASRQTKVDVRRAAIERARQFQRNVRQRGAAISGEDVITEEVEEVIVEEVEEEEEEVNATITTAGVGAQSNSPAEAEEEDDWDAPPPPLDTAPDDVPPPPPDDDDEWDAPPPPPPESEDPPPPPPPPNDDDEWDAPPPPPES
jgi:hypothetical protein